LGAYWEIFGAVAAEAVDADVGIVLALLASSTCGTRFTACWDVKQHTLEI
jgi:hypothetical protein